MATVTLCLLALLAYLGILLIRKMKKAHRYWEDCGVYHLKPSPIIGNWWPLLSGKCSMGEFYDKVYKDNPNRNILGLYSFFRPILMVRDPELTERVFIKDFSHFVNRGFESAITKRPTDHGLVQLKNDHWRAMRVKLTPVFTSGKLKTMFHQGVKCSENLVQMIQKRGNGEYELKSILSVLSSDIIASCAFGLDLEAELTPDSEFVQKAQRVFSLSPFRLLLFFILTTFESMTKFIKVSVTPDDVSEYFESLLEKVIKARRSTKVERKDFVNYLLQLQEKGSLKLHKEAEDEYLMVDQDTEESKTLVLTDDLLMAQALLFLTAGFETTSLTMNYALLHLSMHPEYQDRVRQEINEVLDEYNGQITYEALTKMTLLDQIIKETLRLHPVGVFLARECVKEYSFPDGTIVKPGQLIIVPVRGFHMDPQYFPDPDRFYPERFQSEPVKGTYLPFGAGPRMCIGMRFAQVNTKLGLAALLKNFSFSPSPKTELPLTDDPKSFSGGSLQKIYAKITSISL